ELDQLCINTLRFLCVDAVQKANSGHPGAPMGMAAMAYTLWDRVLRHNPADPTWPDRDRFILSAGHASTLLYSLLYMTGYDLSLEEIKNFRQWGSKTPGHPEYGHAPGVETTTGPLGQGFATGVGMAIAERWLAAQFNRPGYELFDHYTYAIVSDGDLQEGVAAEAASLAGTLKLGRLIYLYDDNDIQIEGSTDVVFTEDVAERFRAYDWQVIGPIDGNDVAAVEKALREAQDDEARPSLIICRTVIGYGSPRAGQAKAHGEPLGEENVREAKENLGWPVEPPFYVPDEALAHMREALDRGRQAQEEWQQRLEAYRREYPDLAARLEQQLSGELPEGWDEGLEELFPPGSDPIATRSASGKVLNALAEKVAALMGGSADLGPSNKTVLENSGDFSAEDRTGRNLHFGVREHAMGAIANGLALHGGVIPYTGTFLVFSDYMRPAIRLAAMMGLRVVYVFTHDSIGLGEDGPTHQPVEHLLALRAVPKLYVLRPADATETAQAWRAALLHKDGPTALALTRQNLPVLDRSSLASAEGVRKGGYVLWESGEGTPEVILMASGSEVEIALEAGQALAEEGKAVRVVSFPCWKLFDEQPQEYRDEVLPPQVKARVAIEAGVTMGWERYVGPEGKVIGLDHFGASAPYKTLYEKFGLTPEAVASAARELLGE
ncbi:MAG: transketolase, partial [Armatimonadetes bacterium]|nr:transketolase [Armatimonadota bacterium]